MSKETPTAEKALDEILSAVADFTGWSKAESRNFIRCISAKRKKDLPLHIEKAIHIAAEAETIAAYVDLMKKMGRLINAQIVDDKLAWRLDPGCEVSRAGDGSLEIKLPDDFQDVWDNINTLADAEKSA